MRINNGELENMLHRVKQQGRRDGKGFTVGLVDKLNPRFPLFHRYANVFCSTHHDTLPRITCLFSNHQAVSVEICYNVRSFNEMFLHSLFSLFLFFPLSVYFLFTG